ncbi:hypothetical protein UlMin_004862 [Ulmus minor]
MPLLPYAPLCCRNCRSILNPFSIVDFAAKIWICPFCFQRNHFPPHYASISDFNLPAELFPQYTTIEYQDTNQSLSSIPPVFMFVVDTCIIEEEMGYLKSALSQAIDLLPDHSLVGLITFGTFVHVHELGFGQIPKTYVFKGSKDVSKDQLLDHLNFFDKKPKPPTGMLEELQKDPWPVVADQRSTRCTSTALSVAASLLGACVPGSGARIMAFIGGPSTEGPGAIVSKNLSEPIRSHKDLDKDSATHFHKAVKFYEGISKQLVHQGHVLDLFACALDQKNRRRNSSLAIVFLFRFYQHSSGQMRLCVTTLSRRWVAGQGSIQELISGFDQEAAAAVMARLVSFKMEAEAEFDPIRLLDKALIHICSRFGSNTTTLCVLLLKASNVARNVLNGYRILDGKSVALTFYSCPVYQHTSICFEPSTCQCNAFAQLLQALRDDADAIIKERFPVPRLVVCDQHGSQARFLLAKLNPSATYNNNAPLPGGDVIFTDDVSLEVFLDHLQRLAVQ